MVKCLAGDRMGAGKRSCAGRGLHIRELRREGKRRDRAAAWERVRRKKTSDTESMGGDPEKKYEAPCAPLIDGAEGGNLEPP